MGLLFAKKLFMYDGVHTHALSHSHHMHLARTVANRDGSQNQYTLANIVDPGN